ncbi:hypothetical protein BDP27DRAFT_519418 [Rhodocollybia butyracea]|uniref:Uncharacterized protein n=1 Tax=Rhodocollybia butyracea TaxID=206335 RepID=A0A9P5Q0N5_9AGAR|nr:hypothetical protein BDP27DRAFT_519418 [Rhodocollybia butyracea]
MARSSRAATTLPAYRSVDNSPPPSYSSPEPQSRGSSVTSYSSQSSESSITSCSPTPSPSRYTNYTYHHLPDPSERSRETNESDPLLEDKATRRSSANRNIQTFIAGVLVGIFCLYFLLSCLTNDSKFLAPWRKSKLTSYWYNVVPEQTCHSIGAREYSATLANIPSDWDPLEACQSTALSVHGKRVMSPPACSVFTFDNSTAVEGRWIVDFDESECLPLWSPINAESCASYGVRPYHADIVYVPPGLDALASCRDTPLVIHEQSVRPTHCELLVKEDEALGRGPLVVARGHWNVEESSCAPKWVLNTDSQCFSYNKKKYTAVLTGIPEELDPIETCYEAPLPLFGSAPKPQSCDRDGDGRVIGTWYFGDAYCRPVLKAIQNYVSTVR